MRTMSTLVLAALIASPATAAPTPQQLETTIWQTFKDKKAEAFKAMFTPNYVGLYEDGPGNVAKELQSMKDTNLRSFAISNFSSRAMDPDDVLTIYAVDVKGTRGKADASGRYWASSVWHRAGNRWLTAYHTEMKAKK